MNVEEILREYQAYRPEVPKPEDLDAFWEGCLLQSKKIPLALQVKAGETGNAAVEGYEIWYDGCDGSRIHGVVTKPAHPSGKLPTIVHYHGYGGNGGDFSSFCDFNALGYAVLSIDMRGQGGQSENRYAYSCGEERIAMGATDPQEYYMKWLLLDCVRAIDVACTFDFVDPDFLCVMGGSQGGGISVTMAALDGRVKACVCDIPSNSDIIRRIEGSHGMYTELTRFIAAHPACKEQVYRTVGYFDTINLAERIKAPVFASVGLLDEVCPAKMFYATYNRITAPKQIVPYPEVGHAVTPEHHQKKLAYFRSLLD